MSTLVERLRDVGCDREPFTSEHAKCVCRLANEAADEIDKLKAENERLADALKLYIATAAATRPQPN